MEIRVLKYFLAVAREGSITGAANSLHLTQPTLTRQLQDLEKEHLFTPKFLHSFKIDSPSAGPSNLQLKTSVSFKLYRERSSSNV